MTSTTLASVQQIWRYPGKSMLGEQLETGTVTNEGLLGDRGWAVRDEVRGGIRGAKKIGALMHLGARYLAPPSEAVPTPHIEITLPDGTRVTSSDANVNARLTAALDHPVSLFPLQPAADLDHYRRGAADSDDLMVELRDIFGRLEDEPLPDFSVFPPEILEYESPPGTYLDAFPIQILSTQSLRTLSDLLPDAAIDLRRFRPNLVVEAVESDADRDDEFAPWPELSWVGRQITVGEAVLEVVTPCPRCVMITRPVGDLPEDRSIMRTVVREAGQNLGVYARVVRPGIFATNDPVLTDF